MSVLLDSRWKGENSEGLSWLEKNKSSLGYVLSRREIMWKKKDEALWTLCFFSVYLNLILSL